MTDTPTLTKLSCDAYLRYFTQDAAALAQVARTARGRQVPTCPGWTVAHLLAHLGKFYGWLPDVLNHQKPETIGFGPDKYGFDYRLDGLVEWYTDRAAALTALLQEVETDTRVWTWWPGDSTAGFWLRRAAQETAIHRWDAQNAVGPPEPIDAELARDGIDETLEVFARAARSGSLVPANGETYHLHRTDGDGEWFVRFTPAEVEIERRHRKADVALRGSASDLLLFLWKRLPAGRLDIAGHQDLVPFYFELVPPL